MTALERQEHELQGENIKLEKQISKLSIDMIQQEKAWNNAGKRISFLEKTRSEINEDLSRKKDKCRECEEKIANLKRLIKNNKDEIERKRSSANTLKSTLKNDYKARISQLNDEISKYDFNHIKAYGYNLSECKSRGYPYCVAKLEDLEKAKSLCEQRLLDWQQS